MNLDVFVPDIFSMWEPWVHSVKPCVDFSVCIYSYAALVWLIPSVHPSVPVSFMDEQMELEAGNLTLCVLSIIDSISVDLEEIRRAEIREELVQWTCLGWIIDTASMYDRVIWANQGSTNIHIEIEFQYVWRKLCLGFNFDEKQSAWTQLLKCTCKYEEKQHSHKGSGKKIPDVKCQVRLRERALE